MAAKDRKYLHIRNYDRQRRDSNGKSEVFDHTELEEIVPGDSDYDRRTTGNGNIAVLGANLAILVGRPSLRSRLTTFVGLVISGLITICVEN